ncbi:MAG: hypothetical protein IPN58_12325 [Anaerolineales bacterium]|nr:hypothetical protein [Anaerolineales bacterium]
MDRSITRRGITLIVVSVVVVFSFFSYISSVGANATLCGNGSAPDYGFTYDLQQAHWTVDPEGYASEQTMSEVDVILDRLNGDSIAQTMILFNHKPGSAIGQLCRAFSALHAAWFANG